MWLSFFVCFEAIKGDYYKSNMKNRKLCIIQIATEKLSDNTLPLGLSSCKLLMLSSVLLSESNVSV